MKRPWSLKSDWFVLYLFLILFVLATAVQWRRGLDDESHLNAKRLAHAFIPLLTKAHHEKDDLVLQEAMTALAQAPGIAFACIVNEEEKVIAHNRLALIGKPFEFPHHSDHLYSFPLKAENSRWGTLVFSLSANALHTLWLKEMALLGGFFLLLGFSYGVRLGVEARRIARLQQALTDQKSLWDEEQREKENLQNELSESKRHARAWFQTMLEKMTEPVLLLDARQRVVAFNSDAKQLLGLGKIEDSDYMSWQDVLWLQDQGAALEQSLLKPGQEVLVENGAYEAALKTEPPWTWVKPRSALRVCR